MINELNTSIGVTLSSRVNAQEPGGRPQTQGRTEAASASQESAQNAQAELRQTAAVDRRSLNQAVNDLSKALGEGRTNIHFDVDDDSGQMIIKVIDTENGQTIRQLPPEEVLELAKFFEEMEKSRTEAQNQTTGHSHLEGLLIRVKA